ncbi:MAG TPA: pitrilysin family protein [Myxococcota bacterium]
MAQKTLANGLQVIVVENHALPLITVELAAKNGSMTEPPDYNGLSHLYEHMFFKGNQVLPNQEAFMAKSRALGMQFNAETGQERVNYYFTTTSDHLADTMAFMHDAAVTPLFDPKELDRERVVITGEMDRNEANPGYYLNHEAMKHLFYKYPSRKDPLGDRATVLKTTVDQMKTIQNRYYVPNNSALFVVGDVKADDIFAMADKLYGDWKKADDPFVKFPLVEHPALKASSVVVVQQPVQIVVGAILWMGPSVKGKEIPMTYAADLLTFSEGPPSSKFNQHLVDSGACVGVGMGWQTAVNVGPIAAQFEATPDKVDACIKGLLAEMPKIKDASYISDDELKSGTFNAEMQDMQARELPSELSHTLSFWWATAGLDYYVNYVPNLKKATRADINTYLDTYVINKPFVLAVMVSPEMAKAGLDEKHFNAVVGVKP